MRTSFVITVEMLLMVLTFEASALAQGSANLVGGEKCRGRIYQPNEFTQRHKVSSKPAPGFTPEAIAHNVRGRVVLSAVLCRTGKVTDVQVIEGLPFGMTEKAIEAARQIKFEPAERNHRQVSEVIRLEYNFGYIGERGLPAKEPIAGRMVETVELSGLRSIQPDEIMTHLKTRPGELYNQETVTADLRSLLALGFFDALETRVRVEDGHRGGVKVVFELAELKTK